MTKKSLLTVLISILALTALILTACTPASVATLEISEDSEYKTRYAVGEELDINGIKLVIGLTDGTSRTVNATDVRSDLKITGFDTSAPKQTLSVILVYKGATATYNITVVDPDDDTQKCKITFETGEGSEIEDVYLSAYSFVSVPDEPERDGYAFDGWYKEKTYNNAWNFNTDKVVEDTVLYAKWSKLYTVTFIDEINGVENIVRYVKEGATLTDVPTLPTRDGEYGEWDRKVFTDIHTDIVVHSVYTPMTYTVRFVYLDSDGKTQVEVGTFASVPHGEDLSVTQEDRIREIEETAVPEYNAEGNKHFVGWDVSFNHIVSDLTVTAVYVVNSYSVTFDLNYDCEDVVYTVTSGVAHGNAVATPAVAPEREGYVFDGWYRQAECVKAWDFSSDRVTSAVRLYAKWTKLVYVRYLIPQDVVIDAETDPESPVTLGTYVLTEGGMPVVYKVYYVSEVRIGGNAEKPAVPARHGYRGVWGIDDAVLQNVQNDIPVKVNYSIITDYKVRFYDYNRTLLDTQEVTFGESAVAPATEPSRTGYVFTGWDKDFGYIDGDLDVTALYEAGVYKVKYYPNNGISAQTIEVKCDSRVNLQTFTYENYSFKGWYSDPAFGEYFDISTSLLLPEYTEGKEEGDIVLELYAKWLRVYKIYFYGEDGAEIDVESVEEGSVPTNVPEMAEKTGYSGVWCEKNSEGAFLQTEYDFTEPVYGLVRLYPKYTINRYTVRFYVDNSVYMTVQVEYGKYVEYQITDPEIEGRTFKGWDKSVGATPIVDDTDFTALFETITFIVTWGKDSGITSVVDYGNAAVFPITATAPVKRGYTLSGWRVASPDGGDMTSVKADLILEPEFKINTYSVTFKDRDTNASYTSNDGDTETQTQYGMFVKFTVKESDGVIDNPEKTGYTFIGWQAGLDTVGYSSEGWYLSGGPDDAEADCYTLGGYLVISDGKYYYLSASERNLLQTDNWESIVPEITLTDGKWNYGATTTASAKRLAFNGVYYCIKEDVTFFATFEVSRYTVTYVTNMDGVELDDEVLQYGTVLKAPKNPETEGKVFLGWYTDDNCTERFYFDGKTISSDITLYAKWEEQTASTDGLVYTLSADGESYALTSVLNLGADVTSVTVANYYNGKPVTAIGVEAFAGATGLVSVDLPNTLETIGPKAFMGCTSLVSIEIPASVRVIPDNAFNGCTSLTTVAFRQGSIVDTIGKSAFSGATALAYSKDDNGNTVAFALPSTIVSIDAGAFHSVLGITSLTIPASVVDIGDRAFAGANNLRYVKFERNTPCNLGSDVFLNTTALAKAFRIYVANTVAYQATSAGENWIKLSSVITSSSLVTNDGEWAYRETAKGAELVQYLGDDTEIVIPDTVSVSGNPSYAVNGLGDYVFDTRVTSVKLRSTQSISENTFGSATSLRYIAIEIISAGAGYAVNSEYLGNAYGQCPDLDTLNLISPSITLTDIFGGNAPTALTRVELDGIEIAGDILANCAYIKEVVIKNATTIGAQAFINCTALEKVTFVNSNVKTINARAFQGCISLGSQGFLVDDGQGNATSGMPSTITLIGENAFDGTAWLNGNTQSLVVIGDGILYKYQGSDSVVYIPSTVKGITAYAFADNQKITRVVVLDPDNSLMETIGEYAFSNCVRLESVVIPAKVASIGKYAFNGCSKLTTVALFNKSENALTKTDDSAFNGVSSNISYYADASVSETYNNNINAMRGKVVAVDGMNVDCGSSEENEKWLYSAETNGTVILIKYLGNSDAVAVPDQINGKTVSKVANYAFTRSTTSLTFRATIAGYNDATSVFGGVTELTSLSIRNSEYGSISQSLIMGLLQANTKLTSLNVTSARSMSTLIGGTLPSNIKTVNILEGETVVADEFIKDSASVETVTVTVDGVVYDLKDTIDLENHTITQIGAKAFAGTAWIDSYPGDYVIVLNGNLVDYKGKNSILSIPDSVTYINAGVFQRDSFIEIVTIPASVKKIGANAFNNATKLTKVFVEGATLPEITKTCFTTGNGFEIYVSESAYPSSTQQTGWAKLNNTVKSDKGIVGFDNKINEYKTNGNVSEVHRQYIIQGTTLILAREYVATYKGEELLTVAETGSVAITETITDKDASKTYGISALGNNAFMSGAEYISIELGFAITDYTFTNVTSLKQLSLTGIDLSGRGFTGEALRNIIVNKKVASLAYDGSVTLDELLNVTDVSVRDNLESYLNEIEIYDGVTETIEGLLDNYDFITSVKYPDGMLKIGINSFEDTAWYKNYSGNFVVLGGVLYKYKGTDATVVIPANVTVINENAFAGGSRLSRIRFATGSVAHTIGENAFNGCAYLGNITLPDTMVNIAPSAFDGTAFTYTADTLLLKGDTDATTLVYYRGSDTKITIPRAVTTISANAFKGNTALTSVSVEQDGRLTTIHEYAFNGCTNLADITLPSTLSYIGKEAFHGTAWFASAIEKGNNVIVNGVLYQKLTDEREFTVTSDIKSITEGAFGGTYNGKEVYVESVALAYNAHISAKELYAILSDERVHTFCSNGALTLAELIGTSEVLENITVLSFDADKVGSNQIAVCDGYADGWYGVVSVTDMSLNNIKSIGEYAFRGTAWYENLTGTYSFAGSSGILIKYNGTDKDITIGGGTGVRGMTADVFRGNTTIESVEFNNESTLIEIPARAFENCVNLASITLPSTVSVFGEDAFKGTAWLENYESDYVVIGGKLIDYIGESGEIVIPENVTKIYSYVFAGNEDITSVTFSRYNLMTEIEADTFEGCTNLESVTLSENIENVDRTAFENTSWFDSVSRTTKYLYYTDTYNGVKKIVLYLGSDAEVRIPADVTEISATAFRGVTSMSALIVPNNTLLTSIPAYAFKDCTSLETVTIAESVKEIGEGAFEGTKWLQTTLSAQEFVVVNGKLIGYKGTDTEVTLPDTVNVIGKEAFRGLTKITSIAIPESVTEIEAYAFEGCTALASVTMGANVATVGDYAFDGTLWLDNSTSEFVIVNGTLVGYNGTAVDVTIPTDVTAISAGVFAGNTTITSIALNGEVAIGGSAFKGCTALASVTGVEYILSACADSFDGTPYGTSLLNNGYLVVNGALVAYNGTDVNIVIPADVTRVEKSAFAGNTNIVSVSFELVEASLTIGAYAFENCTKLSSVTLSENIETIGKRAFYNTAWLKESDEDLIMTAGGKILAYVAEGTSVVIPAEAKLIADGVFSGNQRIESLSFDSKCNIDIPAYAFKDCASLSSIVFPTSSFEIGEGAFEGTLWLTNESNKSSAKGYVVVRGKLIAYAGTSTEINIPGNVTYIYDYVFRGNTEITKLTFASGCRMTSITGETFKGCTSLETVEFRSAMDYLDMGAFEGTPWSANQKSNGDFIVVDNKLLAYVGNGGDIEIPSSVNSLGAKVFAGNTTITSVTFAQGSYVSVIPAETFAGCINLTSVMLPTEIEDIGKDAFKDTPWFAGVLEGKDENGGMIINDAYVLGGKALIYVGTGSVFTLPDSVSEVGASFFGTEVTGLIIESDFVSTVTFASGALSTITDIWVPENLVDAYRTAEFWSTYAYKIKAIQG